MSFGPPVLVADAEVACSIASACSHRSLVWRHLVRPKRLYLKIESHISFFKVSTETGLRHELPPELRRVHLVALTPHHASGSPAPLCRTSLRSHQAAGLLRAALILGRQVVLELSMRSSPRAGLAVRTRYVRDACTLL